MFATALLVPAITGVRCRGRFVRGGAKIAAGSREEAGTSAA